MRRLDGQTVYVVGCGPSMSGFDWSLLKGEATIGCNHAMFHTAMGLANDGQWVREFGARVPEGVEKFWLRTEYEWSPPAGWNVIAKSRPERWTDRLEDGLLHGPLTGLTAIHLADVLGASEIRLLGFDMSPVGRTHYHDEYVGRAGFGATPAAYAGHFDAFRRWAGCIRAEVVNLNIYSALDVFPKRQPLVMGGKIRGLIRVREGAAC